MKQNPYLPGTPEEFIKNNMKLAQSIAWKFIKRLHQDEDVKFDKDDYLSIAYIGLMKAYQKFDPTRFSGQNGGKIKFSTYAVPMIKGELLRHIRDLGYTIRKSRNGQVISTDSLDRTIFEDDGNSITLAEKIQSEDYENDDRLIVKDFLSYVDDPRLQEIYKLRLLDLTQREIGEILGLSQVQIGRCERRLFDLAREYGKGDKMMAKYPDELKERIRTLSATKSSGDIRRIIKSEFPQVDVPAGTIASLTSQYRKANERGEQKLNEVASRQVTPEEAEKHGVKIPLLEGIEWFEDITVPTISSLGVTKSGLTFNAAAVQEMKLEIGCNVRIGLSKDGRLFFGKHNQGLKVKKREPNGGAITNKGIIDWIMRKKIEFKRYPIRFDKIIQMYYVKVFETEDRAV